MSVVRLFAIAVIFGVVSLAWLGLGGSMEYRTAELKDSLSAEVNSLWGPADLVQAAPCVVQGGQKREPLSSNIEVGFEHDLRYKGLLWFSTYAVSFRGVYGVQASGQKPASFILELPRGVRSLEDFEVALDGRTQSETYRAQDSQETHSSTNPEDSTYTTREQASRPVPQWSSAGGAIVVTLPSDDAVHELTVAYKTRGRDSWLYDSNWPGQHGPALLRDFTLTATTNFADIDYPDGSISPSKPAQPVGDGMKAVWHYGNLRSAQTMGIQMPRRANAGPLAARMSLFAPVSLFFFFTVLFTVVVLKHIPLHPMHYLFIAAGFFAFHILMAYLVDVVNIHAAFWTCAAVSVLLVVSYMRLVGGVKFAVFYVGVAQLVYLVGFSYAFFWEGRTGLTITIGAIATLFILMQTTGRVDWAQVFARKNGHGLKQPVAPPPLPSETPDDAEEA